VNRKDYIYDHGLLISFISVAMCKELKWTGSDIPQKLTYAAFFHDIMLEDPELAKIMDMDDPLLENYSKEEIEDFKKHPIYAEQLVQESKKFPPDVDHILISHHEKVDGTGFPHAKGPLALSQLICAFIVAHRFVTKTFKTELNPEFFKKSAQEIFYEYSHGNFKLPAKALLDYISKGNPDLAMEVLK
jgi:response regulator RpfG family c-di-GMP phosphodiesterase